MKILLLCALLCAAPTISHAADAPAPVGAPQPVSVQLAWKTAIAVNDIEAARGLVAAPGFSPTLKIEGWNQTLINGALKTKRGEIAALMLQRAPTKFLPSVNSDLIKLGATENLPALRALLAMPGFDPNLRMGKDKITPLSEAAGEANVEAIRLLLANARTDVNARDGEGLTALMRAAAVVPYVLPAMAPLYKEKHCLPATGAQIVALLLSDKRCNAGAADKKGIVALDWAAIYGASTPALELLALDALSRPDKQNKVDATVVSNAVKRGNLRSAESLLALREIELGADLDAKLQTLRAKEGQQAPLPIQQQWLRIIVANDVAGARALAGQIGFDPQMKVPGGDTLLGAALEREHSELAIVLIDAAPTEAYLSDENARLTLARVGNLPVLTRFLARADFDPNRNNSPAQPLLVDAVDAGNVEGVRALLRRADLNPNATGKFGRNALFAFTALLSDSSNAPTIAALLLADPRVEPNQYTTGDHPAICEVAQYGSAALVKVFANDARVDSNIADSFGQTPLYFATARDANLENVKALLDSRRVVIGPKERAAIDKKKAELGISDSPVLSEAK